MVSVPAGHDCPPGSRDSAPRVLPAAAVSPAAAGPCRFAVRVTHRAAGRLFSSRYGVSDDGGVDGLGTAGQGDRGDGGERDRDREPHRGARRGGAIRALRVIAATMARRSPRRKRNAIASDAATAKETPPKSHAYPPNHTPVAMSTWALAPYRLNTARLEPGLRAAGMSNYPGNILIPLIMKLHSPARDVNKRVPDISA